MTTLRKKTNSRLRSRIQRKKRIRKRIAGTNSRPRLCVFRSLKYTYAQLISDESGQVLAAASTRTVTAEGKSSGCLDSAKCLGTRIAELAKEQNIETVVFDRNGNIFHGRVAAVADAAREAGLKL